MKARSFGSKLLGFAGGSLGRIRTIEMRRRPKVRAALALTPF